MFINVVFSLDPPLFALLKVFSFDFDHRLTTLENSMGQLTDSLAELKASDDAENASLDQAIARVQADVAAFTQQGIDLQAKIDALQAQVDAGLATPADIQALADLKASSDARKAKLDGLDPTNPTTLPPPPEGGGVGPAPVEPVASAGRRV